MKQRGAGGTVFGGEEGGPCTCRISLSHYRWVVNLVLRLRTHALPMGGVGDGEGGSCRAGLKERAGVRVKQHPRGNLSALKVSMHRWVSQIHLWLMAIRVVDLSNNNNRSGWFVIWLAMTCGFCLRLKSDKNDWWNYMWMTSLLGTQVDAEGNVWLLSVPIHDKKKQLRFNVMVLNSGNDRYMTNTCDLMGTGNDWLLLMVIDKKILPMNTTRYWNKLLTNHEAASPTNQNIAENVSSPDYF